MESLEYALAAHLCFFHHASRGGVIDIASRTLASLSVAESVAKRSRIICSNNLLYLGTQVMQLTIVVNERKSESDYYDSNDE